MQGRQFEDGTSPRKYEDEDFRYIRPKKYRKPKSVITAHGQKRLFSSVFLIAVCFIAVLSATAYTAQIKYEINEKNKRVTALKTEIDGLYLDVERLSTAENIEKRAMTELGMVYPDAMQRVLIKEDEKSVAKSQQ